MTTATERVKVHQACGVAPSDTTAELRLPLTFFDVLWIYFHPIQRILFFHHPISSQEFLDTVVPRLKALLSETLNRYLPLAGNLVYPLNSDLPELQYSLGDSVSITFTEADKSLEFDNLTAHKIRNADEFYNLVPDLPARFTDYELDLKKTAVLAIQVTLFSEKGLSIGFINHHAVGDASSIVGFIKAWSSEAKLGRNQYEAPIFDRSLIDDPSRRRATIFWNQMKGFNLSSLQQKFPTNKNRATFVLQKNQIQFLKNLALTENPKLPHLSSFTVAVAYSWVCWVKSAAKSGELVDDNEHEYLGFAVNARNRIDPPLPEAYFGNCLAFAVMETTHGELKSEGGFFKGVDLVSECISKKVNNKDEILKDADDWVVKYGPLMGKRVFGVAGSPRFDLYEVDFGWGGAKKFEAVSIDGDEGISLSKSPEFEGGLEIGLSAMNTKMTAFAEIFRIGLNF